MTLELRELGDKFHRAMMPDVATALYNLSQTPGLPEHLPGRFTIIDQLARNAGVSGLDLLDISNDMRIRLMKIGLNGLTDLSQRSDAELRTFEFDPSRRHLSLKGINAVRDSATHIFGLTDEEIATKAQEIARINRMKRRRPELLLTLVDRFHPLVNALNDDIAISELQRFRHAHPPTSIQKDEELGRKMLKFHSDLDKAENQALSMAYNAVYYTDHKLGDDYTDRTIGSLRAVNSADELLKPGFIGDITATFWFRVTRRVLQK